jgi:DNA polymerase-3 subunit delta
MMANYKLVIVKEAQDLKKTIENLAPYIANPVPSTILVFCYKYETLDKRKSFSKTIDKTAVLFESKRIYDNQVQPWIVNYLRERNYKISPPAAYLLAESVGTDLSKVVNELSKLVITLPQGTEILPDHIEQNIGISKDFNIFELTKALGKKDVYKSNLIIRHFAKNEKENPLVKVVPTLYGYFNKTIMYHQLTDKSKNSVASELGVSVFFVDDYVTAAKNYSMGKLVKIISLMREYDVKSKGVDTGTTSDGDLMKELVYKILH